MNTQPSGRNELVDSKQKEEWRASDLYELVKLFELAHVESGKAELIHDWLVAIRDERYLLENRRGLTSSLKRGETLRRCQALADLGDSLLQELRRTNELPLFRWDLADMLMPDSIAGEQNFIDFSARLEHLHDELYTVVTAATKLGCTLREQGKRGGRPKETERDEIVIRLFRLIEAAMVQRSQDHVMGLTVDVFNLYFCQSLQQARDALEKEKLSTEAALKILAKTSGSPSKESRKKPSEK